MANSRAFVSVHRGRQQIFHVRHVILVIKCFMIDQISKLKDHVNVSIMKAVQVDESKDTMCSLGESLYTDSNQLEDMKVFEYLL
jgi:hypothetical protein